MSNIVECLMSDMALLEMVKDQDAINAPTIQIVEKTLVRFNGISSL